MPIHSYKTDIHDSLTRHVNSWEISITTIKKLISLNADVVADIVLTKENCYNLTDTLRLIHSLGLRRIMINHINIGGVVLRNSDDLLMNSAELKMAFKEASIVAKALKLSISSNVCTPICVLNPKDYKGIRFSSCSFDITSRPITVDSLGNIRFCNHSPIDLGNIFLSSIEDIFKSERIKQWKSIVPDFCMDCKAYDICKSVCRAASEQLGLSLHHPDPIMDYMELDEVLLKKLKTKSTN